MMRLVRVHIVDKNGRFLREEEGIQEMTEKIIKVNSTVYVSKKWGCSVVVEPKTPIHKIYENQ